MKSVLFLLALATVGFPRGESPNDSCSNALMAGKATLSSQSYHYVQLGGALVENSGINDRLLEHGYGEYSRYALSLGVGSARVFKRYVNVSDFEMLLWRRNKQNNVKGVLNISRFTSLHGVLVVARPSFALYPLAGIGVGGTTLKLWPAEVAFDDALTNGTRSIKPVSMFQATFIGDIGLGMHLSRPASCKKTGTRSIGLRVGYIIDPITSKRWYRDHSVVTGGPDNDLSGPYLRITLGGSGMHGRRNRNHACGHDRCVPGDTVSEAIH